MKIHYDPRLSRFWIVRIFQLFAIYWNAIVLDNAPRINGKRFIYIPKIETEK